MPTVNGKKSIYLVISGHKGVDIVHQAFALQESAESFIMHRWQLQGIEPKHSQDEWIYSYAGSAYVVIKRMEVH